MPVNIGFVAVKLTMSVCDFSELCRTRMTSLSGFPDPPSSGLFTVCEKNAELITSPVDGHLADQVGQLLVKVSYVF